MVGQLLCCVDVHSHVRLSVTPWTAVHRAPLSMAFSRQEYWSGLLFPSPGDLPNPGIEGSSPALQAVSLPSEPYYIPSYSANHLQILVHLAEFTQSFQQPYGRNSITLPLQKRIPAQKVK